MATFAILNPAWKSVVETKADQHKAAVLAWMQANPTNRLITLAELRAGLPAIAADLSRAVVNQIAQDLGCQVEGDDDAAA